MNVSELLGKTITKIERAEKGDDVIDFTLDTGEQYRMWHNQDCCEGVCIEDISGDLNNLLNSPLTMAEETSNSDDLPARTGCESYTWTYYKFATINGYVTIRWFGSSNGYYSESVDILKVKEADPVLSSHVRLQDLISHLEKLKKKYGNLEVFKYVHGCNIFETFDINEIGFTSGLFVRRGDSGNYFLRYVEQSDDQDDKEYTFISL